MGDNSNSSVEQMNMNSQRETDVGNQVSNLNCWNRDPDTWSIKTFLSLI